MKKKSFQIALSAVSAALATVFMIMGLNVPFMFISGYVFAGIALMLPLAENFRAGGFLAYVATSLLCLPFGGIVYFYKLFPFVAFFGLHALVNSFQKKWKIKRWIAWAVKAVWFVGMLCAEWAMFSEFFAIPFAWIERWIYLIMIIGGAALFLAYDLLMIQAQKLVDFYVSKIDRGGKGRGKRTADKDRNAAPKDVGDVFDGFSQNNRTEGEEAENPSEDDKDVDKKEDCGEDGNKGVDGQ